MRLESRTRTPLSDGPAEARRSPARWLEVSLLFLHLAALALALGAPIVFGALVVPAAFEILPTRDLAAALQSPILTGLCRGLQGAFIVLLGSSFLLARWWSAAPLSRALMTRAAILGVIGAIVLEKLLIPPIERIRLEAPGLIDDLPAADPSRLLLNRYHRLSTGLFAMEIAAAALLLLVTARLLAAGRVSAPRRTAAPPPVPKLLDLS